MAKTTRKGNTTFTDYSKEVNQDIIGAILGSLKTGGKAFITSSRIFTPVDTNNLRSSESVVYFDGTSIGGDAPIGRPEKNTAVAFTNVKYAEYVHNGTARSKGQPFFRLAGAKVATFIFNTFKKLLGRV